MSAHVLFVDDEEPNLVVFEAVCGDDFEVLTANSGEDGLKLLREHDVAVVLSDQRMPGMTGTELLEKVQEEYPDTIRLLITAYSDLQAAEDAINRGHVRRYLRKPWEPESLKAELRDAMDLYDMNDKMKRLERRLVETERAYSLGVAAAGVADEIRSPVGWVNNNLQVCETSIGTVASILGEDPPNLTRARGILTQLSASVSDARMGVRRILELADSMAKPPEDDEQELIDLTEIVRLTLRMAERSGLRGQALIEVTGGSTKVRASRTRLSQIALNLLANALQAVGSQGPQGVVRISTNTEGDIAKLEVTDNGPGLNAEQLENLFNPFGTAIDAKGGGVGLAISKRIAKSLSGELTAERASTGMKFTLKLPKA